MGRKARKESTAALLSFSYNLKVQGLEKKHGGPPNPSPSYISHY
jgi:hypothetical protein